MPASTKSKPKSPLRVPQVRILIALRKHLNRGLTRPEIAVRAKVSPSMTANLGSTDPDVQGSIEERYGKQSLLSLGLVRARMVENEDSGVNEFWYITAKGLKAIDGLK